MEIANRVRANQCFHCKTHFAKAVIVATTEHSENVIDII
jgi:hypothetical protein